MAPFRSRLSRIAASLSAAILATHAVALASDLEVPGQYPTIQLALNAASPGDTIRVHGGTYGPIVINKPIRIIGDSNTRITNAVLTGSVQPHNVSLEGPGSGTVQLVSISMVGVTSGFFQAFQGSRVAGTGFSEVHLHECVLDAPTWSSLTGIGFGAAGVAVHLPHFLMSHSYVKGGSNGSDNSVGLPAFNGHAGIQNVNGTVTVLDSVVSGGNGTNANYPPGFVPPEGCPTNLLPGKGGVGVIAREYFTAGSLVNGGDGAYIYELFVYMGQQAPGTPFTAPTYAEFPNTLTDAGVPQPGATWSLTWSSGSPGAVVLISSSPIKPFFYEGAGWVFSDLTEIHAIEAVASGPLPNTVSLTIPPVPTIVGAEFVTQLWDPLDGLGRPIVRVIVP